MEEEQTCKFYFFIFALPFSRRGGGAGRPPVCRRAVFPAGSESELWDGSWPVSSAQTQPVSTSRESNLWHHRTPSGRGSRRLQTNMDVEALQTGHGFELEAGCNARRRHGTDTLCRIQTKWHKSKSLHEISLEEWHEADKTSSIFFLKKGVHRRNRSLTWNQTSDEQQSREFRLLSLLRSAHLDGWKCTRNSKRLDESTHVGLNPTNNEKHSL